LVVAHTTQADEVAQDGDGRYSPFSEAFIDNIREPGVEIGTMFRRIANAVYTRTGDKQIPERSISLLSLRGTFTAPNNLHRVYSCD
jgi:uncharacterized caspase-like protein